MFGTSLIFALISLAIPGLLVWSIIWPSIRKTKKPWLRPFFSHHDFQKELMTVVSISLFGSFWYGVHTLITRENPSLNVDSFNELWIVLFGLFSLLISLIIRSYNGLFFSYIFAQIYLTIKIIWWATQSQFFFTTSSNYISPLAILALVIITVNLTYLLGKYLGQTKILGRFGHLLRFTTILQNTSILVVFSSSLYLRYDILKWLGGDIFLNSYPLLIVFLVTVLLAAFALTKASSLKLNLDELIMSLVPGYALLLLSVFLPYAGTSELAFTLLSTFSPEEQAFNPFAVFCNIFFTALALVYTIYLSYKGNKNGEKWLQITAITLLILFLIYKFFDTAANLGFNGLFLTIFGLVILIAGGIFEYARRKAQNTQTTQATK